MRITKIQRKQSGPAAPEFGRINDKEFSADQWEDGQTRRLVNIPNVAPPALAFDLHPIAEQVTYTPPGSRNVTYAELEPARAFTSELGSTQGLTLKSFRSCLVDQNGRVWLALNFTSTFINDVTTREGRNGHWTIEILCESGTHFMAHIHTNAPERGSYDGVAGSTTSATYYGTSSLVVINKNSKALFWITRGVFNAFYLGETEHERAINENETEIFTKKHILIESHTMRATTASYFRTTPFTYAGVNTEGAVANSGCNLHVITLDGTNWETTASGQQCLTTHFVASTGLGFGPSVATPNMCRQRVMLGANPSDLKPNEGPTTGFAYVALKEPESNIAYTSGQPLTVTIENNLAVFTYDLYEYTSQHRFDIEMPSVYMGAEWQFGGSVGHGQMLLRCLIGKYFFESTGENFYIYFNKGGYLDYVDRNANNSTNHVEPNVPPVLCKIPLGHNLSKVGPQQDIMFPEQFGVGFRERSIVFKDNKLLLFPGVYSSSVEGYPVRSDFIRCSLDGTFEVVELYKPQQYDPPEALGADGGVEWHGEVPAVQFINGTALASLLGFSSGSVYQSNDPWLHVTLDGKELYIAKRPLRQSVSWNHLNNAGLVFGGRIVTINGENYRVRLLKGLADDKTYDDYVSEGGSGWDMPATHGSEWNRIFYRLHEGTSSSAEHKTDSEQPFEILHPFTDADFNMTGNPPAGYSWCQEANPTHAILRGYHSVSRVWNNVRSDNITNRAWRPVLERIPTDGTIDNANRFIRGVGIEGDNIYLMTEDLGQYVLTDGITASLHILDNDGVYQLQVNIKDDKKANVKIFLTGSRYNNQAHIEQEVDGSATFNLNVVGSTLSAYLVSCEEIEDEIN